MAEVHVKRTSLSETAELMKEQLEKGGSVTFSPKGSSMLPMLRASGDSVTLVKPPSRIKLGTAALYTAPAEDGGERFLLHRLVRRKGDLLIFQGDNRVEPDPPVAAGAVIGVVCAYRTRGRDHSCGEAGHRLYKALMVATRSIRPLTRKLRGAAYRIWKKLKG